MQIHSPPSAPDYEPTTLGYALLGLLRDRPQTGYEIRRIFAETPMNSYSSSPGTIYPALKRLQEAGLVTRVPKQAQGSRQTLVLTQAGRSSLQAWLLRPVAAEDVEKRYDGLMLRFAFMNEDVSNEARQHFLRSLRGELEIWLIRLRDYLDHHRAGLTLNGQLALENGIAEVEARLRWTERAQETLRQEGEDVASHSSPSTKERGGKRPERA